jgi:hypothetical protein
MQLTIKIRVCPMCKDRISGALYPSRRFLAVNCVPLSKRKFVQIFCRDCFHVAIRRKEFRNHPEKFIASCLSIISAKEAEV